MGGGGGWHQRAGRGDQGDPRGADRNGFKSGATHVGIRRSVSDLKGRLEVFDLLKQLPGREAEPRHAVDTLGLEQLLLVGKLKRQQALRAHTEAGVTLIQEGKRRANLGLRPESVCHSTRSCARTRIRSSTYTIGSVTSGPIGHV